MSRSTLLRAFWGAVLIVGGLVSLALNIGIMVDPPPPVWMAGLGLLSLLFFASYLISGLPAWGWLFPAVGTGAVASSIALNLGGAPGPWSGAVIVGGFSLPFLVAFILNRQVNWWALIPAWTLAAVTAFILFAERVPGQVVAAGVMFAIGLPFLVVYLADRQRWWALIPAGALAAAGVIPLLTLGASGPQVAAFVQLAVGLPFFIVYLASARAWWALIPAGILASIGAALLLQPAGVRLEAVMYAGWAVTFGGLWLKRATQPTDWARWPALGLALAALAVGLLGGNLNWLGGAAIIALGAWLIWRGLRQRGEP